MRLTILTHYYPPDPGAPQARLAALATGLTRRGFDVTVHTCPPHYPDGIVKAPYSSRRPWSVEHHQGTRVVRSAVLPARNSGTIRRLADHASFALSSVLTAPGSGAADVVLAESPPLFLAGSAVAYARLKQAPLILNVADLWPDSVVDLGMLRNEQAIGAARVLERAAYRAARAITVPTEGMVDRLARRPESAGKVQRMAPSVDLEAFAVEPLARERGPLRVLYAGTIGLAQGLDTLVRAAAIAGPEAVQVTIAGDGAEAASIGELVAREGIANIEMLGAVAAGDVPALYARCDVSAVLLRDRPVFEGALPTKMFEAMAAARPIVVSARGEAAETIRRAGAGVVVAPEDPAALAAALTELARRPATGLREMGARALREAERHGRGPWLDRWESLLEEVAGRKAAAT